MKKIIIGLLLIFALFILYVSLYTLGKDFGKDILRYNNFNCPENTFTKNECEIGYIVSNKVFGPQIKSFEGTQKLYFGSGVGRFEPKLIIQIYSNKDGNLVKSNLLIKKEIQKDNSANSISQKIIVSNIEFEYEYEENEYVEMKSFTIEQKNNNDILQEILSNLRKLS